AVVGQWAARDPIDRLEDAGEGVDVLLVEEVTRYDTVLDQVVERGAVGEARPDAVLAEKDDRRRIREVGPRREEANRRVVARHAGEVDPADGDPRRLLVEVVERGGLQVLDS